MTQDEESDSIKKSYTHGSVDLGLNISPADRQATLEVKVSGDLVSSATVHEGRLIDNIVSHQLPGEGLVLRLEAHKVRITGMLPDGPVDHEVAI